MNVTIYVSPEGQKILKKAKQVAKRKDDSISRVTVEALQRYVGEDKTRGILKTIQPLHLYCARMEDWRVLFTGLLHDERQRFTPAKDEQLPNDGYAPPMALDFYGQTVYVYPPRVEAK